MIWVFSVIKSNMLVSQTIHKGEFPDYKTFLFKTLFSSSVTPIFKEIYYDPLVQAIKQELLNPDPGHLAHAAFKYNDYSVTCCGFKDA